MILRKALGPAPASKSLKQCTFSHRDECRLMAVIRISLQFLAFFAGTAAGEKKDIEKQWLSVMCLTGTLFAAFTEPGEFPVSGSHTEICSQWRPS
ncbi:MAG TPA: hypothetical protein VIO81_13855 [Methyloversatilis sp.]